MHTWICFFLFLRVLLFSTESIQGFWQSHDDQNRAQCIFGVYEKEGIYYGKIIATFDQNGKLKETLEKKESKAEGIVGTPYMCGLDILYGFQEMNNRFYGTIVDPTNGKTYRCELFRQGENLIVRGKLLIFGKNITWYPVDKKLLPKGFKLPDLKLLIPQVPKIGN